jgi:hypothetical protein
MKTPHFRMCVVAAALLPAMAFGAPGAKGKTRPGARPDGATAEVLKNFDKNENKQIDADELSAVQRAFMTLKNLDKNSDGEIEQAEVDALKAPASRTRGGRSFAGLRSADKNSNRKIDLDEIEGLQKALAGSPIMSRLDQNGNGKLEPSEVDHLNQRMEQGRKRLGTSATPPPVRKPPEKKPEEAAPPAEKPKTEEKKDEKPAAPAPEAKPPGNFGS